MCNKDIINNIFIFIGKKKSGILQGIGEITETHQTPNSEFVFLSKSK